MAAKSCRATASRACALVSGSPAAAPVCRATAVGLLSGRRYATASADNSEADAERPLQMTLGLIKPTVCSYQPGVSAVLKYIASLSRPSSSNSTPLDLVVVRQKRLFLKTEEAEVFYAQHKGKFYYNRLIAAMTSGPCVALALAGPKAVEDWRALLGPTKAYRAKWEQPDCLRARFGLGDTRNGFHGSGNVEEARHELGLIFEGFAFDAWLDDEAKKRLSDGRGQARAIG